MLIRAALRRPSHGRSSQFVPLRPPLLCRRAVTKRNNSLSLTPTQQQHAIVLRSRAAERARFGLPVWQLLGCGLVGVVLALQWWTERLYVDRVDAPYVRLSASSTVVSLHKARALLSDVRRVLERHGISLGAVRLEVRLEPGLSLTGLEGVTLKERSEARRRGGAQHLRHVEAIVLQPGLSALHASHVLAHEFMHAWLWMQGFPQLDAQVEEGLCELAAYLFLLSSLRQPSPDAVIEVDEAAFRRQILSIEASAHAEYGAGFQLCVASLRGRKLHDLLGYLRRHGRLPPPLDPSQSGLGFEGIC